MATLAALVALVVAVLAFDLDAGLTSITLAVLLSACWPEDSRNAVSQIAWSTVLLICGVLTYVGVLDEMGTIDWAGEGVSDIGVPLLSAVLLCYIGALVSAFASSVGIMGALIPLAVPFLAQGEIGAGPGRRLGHPSLETAVAVVAVLRAGVAAVPLNPKSGEKELGHILADSAPTLVLAAPGDELPSAYGTWSASMSRCGVSGATVRTSPPVTRTPPSSSTPPAPPARPRVPSSRAGRSPRRWTRSPTPGSGPATTCSCTGCRCSMCTGWCWASWARCGAAARCGTWAGSVRRAWHGS
jgi:hypothetical protein